MNSLQNRLCVMFIAAMTALVATVNAVAQDHTRQEETVKQVVQDNFEAFNRHDVDALIDYVGDPFIWYSVLPDTVVVETYNRERFRSDMEGYFSSYPNARTEYSELRVFGRFAYFTETAVWGAEAEHSQTSLAVFEVIDGRIRRAWYYQ